jgi:transcription elongation factor Elf1
MLDYMKCPICNNNGECKNNENSPLYDENSDYFDCWVYLRNKQPRDDEDIEIWDIERKVWEKQEFPITEENEIGEKYVKLTDEDLDGILFHPN